MKKKQLISALDQIEIFDKPKLHLEQYTTTSELGAEILLTINDDISLEDKCLADLGCGTGLLMIGSAILGASAVVGFDIDKDALKICQKNIKEMELESICDIVRMDVTRIPKSSRIENKFDVILMNPPFGTKNNAGIDLKFVQNALSMLDHGGTLFSLHKTSTRDFLLRQANKLSGIQAECIAELKWNLDKTYRHQKKQVVDIDVDLIMYNKA